ncbi:Aste57867_23581 [Aphanomyces stellatus]|uniref:Purple acid phosphatase n=1 Tax=Aphanomyces stellatus TaxID=120398 RepID=A0A485LPR2_9STRA|nr:hypothetical protein As57867_023510 [Aphanomyces stellatus]VFU00226.1 Aste57867_23581 [Aphanomyces stellatus]
MASAGFMAASTARPLSYGSIPEKLLPPFPRKRINLGLLATIMSVGCVLVFLVAHTTPPSEALAAIGGTAAIRMDVVTEDMLVEPKQIHLAYTEHTAGTGMTVSWTTYRRIDGSGVWFGETADSLSTHVPAKVHTYYADDVYSLYTYHASLDGLTPLTTYFYSVGNESRVSPVYQFRTGRPPQTSDDETFEVAVYADFGERNAEATVQLVTQLKPRLEFIWHVGDISYADNAFHTLNQDNQALGFVYEKAYNAWMDSLGPVMREIPYMVTVGNHEAECYSPACLYSQEKQRQLSNYSAFNTRFRMPANGVHNMWYSWVHGPVHFISISSETDYPDAPTNNKGTTVKNGEFGNQLAWLEATLAAVNRTLTPWVIVGGHRPLYGLKVYKPNGAPKKKHVALLAAFEPLFLKYKVDVVVSGHQHAYERHLPIRESEPQLDGVSDDRSVYVAPTAPVYIVSGSCGSYDGHEPYVDIPAQTWNVLYDNVHFGISTLKANRTALHWEFLHSATGDPIDQFTMVKA